MPTWRCVLTSRRDDGSFTWRRTDAEEPRGGLPGELAPTDAKVGDQVIIEAVSSLGEITVTSCRLVPEDEIVAPTQPENRTAAAPAPDTTTPRIGDIRWANVLNPLENVNSTGKSRPVLLVSSTSTHWRVMGFTTKSMYESTEPRVPIPDWSSIGLTRPGYLWGDRLTRITIDSVNEFIGTADTRLGEAVIGLAGADMTNLEIDALRTAMRTSVGAESHKYTIRQPLPTPVELTPLSLRDFFTRNRVQVESDLEKYFCGDTYTGRNFESFSAESSSEYFDGSNVAAVMSLSVALKARIPSDLHNIRHETSDHLRHVDRSVPIWNQPVEVFGPDGHLQALYDLLRAIPDVGPAIASKLLASKLPHLVPVWDRDVWRLTGEPEQWWLGWHSAMSDSRLREQLRTLRDVTGREDISLLRIADVALWMEAQRRKQNFTL